MVKELSVRLAFLLATPQFQTILDVNYILQSEIHKKLKKSNLLKVDCEQAPKWSGVKNLLLVTL